MKPQIQQIQRQTRMTAACMIVKPEGELSSDLAVSFVDDGVGDVDGIAVDSSGFCSNVKGAFDGRDVAMTGEIDGESVAEPGLESKLVVDAFGICKQRIIYRIHRVYVSIPVDVAEEVVLV